MHKVTFREIAPELELSPEGWWNSPQLSHVSYPAEGNDLCFSIEESSFWFIHRNSCIIEAIKLFPPPGALFDVGGGNGYVARAIQESGIDVVLVEPRLSGARNALGRGVRYVVRATLDNMEMQAETVPGVGLFDVLEHIEDDIAFLKKINRLLVPQGRLYVTVPAYPWLWSDEDSSAGHHRRYTLQKLSGLIERAGFTIDFATDFYSFLPFPIPLFRALPYRLGFHGAIAAEEGIRADHQPNHPLLKRALNMLTRSELSKIGRLQPLRAGGSCLAVARKR
jgi:SAM-dependent methyltransferase